MKMDVHTPISEGQNALVQVYGDYEFGYVKVKLNGAYVEALPDDNPDVPSLQRNVTGSPAGTAWNIWTNPRWLSKGNVTFELYDSDTDTLQDQKSTVIL